MKRPIKEDYLTTNQFEYQEKLNKYYGELEKYIDYLELKVKNNDVLPVVSESCETCKLKKECRDNELMPKKTCSFYIEHVL